MGTSAITGLSTSDITALQNDVNELNTKLNALIVEFNKCSDDTTTNKGKIDDLIDDVAVINTKISGSYTASNYGANSTGTSGDSILKRLQDLDSDFTSLANNVQPGSGINRVGGSGTAYRMNDISSVTTTSTGTGDNTSVNTTPSSVTGSYGAAETKVITIGAKGEVRAKRLARQTLNRLRK